MIIFIYKVSLLIIMRKKIAPKIALDEEMEKNAIIAGALEGLTQDEIGKKFGHDKYWVLRRCRKYGLNWKELVKGRIAQLSERVPDEAPKVRKSRRKKREGVLKGGKLTPKSAGTSSTSPPKVAKSPQIPQDLPVINSRNMFVEVSENALEQYVLYLANTCDPSPQIASLMKDILKEKRAFVQAKGGITELTTDEVQALMGEIPLVPAEKRKDEPEGD